jgi:hypothetical protein
MAPAELKDVGVTKMFGLKHYAVKTQTCPPCKHRLGEVEEQEYHRERVLPKKLVIMPRCNAKQRFP